MKETRTVFKGIRYTDSEAAVVQRAADAAGQKLAEYVHDVSLREGNAHAETERVMEQQRVLYDDMAASIRRQVATATAKVFDEALADVAKRMDRAHAQAAAHVKEQTESQFHVLQLHLARLTATVQGLVDALKPAAPAEPAAPTCPVCGKGHMVAKVATMGANAGKTFYACSAHPTCQHTSWKPDGK